MLTFVGIVLEAVGVLGVLWWAVRAYRKATLTLEAHPPGFDHKRTVHDRAGLPSLAQLVSEVDELKGAIRDEVDAAMYQAHLERAEDVRYLLHRERRANRAAFISAGALPLGLGCDDQRFARLDFVACPPSSPEREE